MTPSIKVQEELIDDQEADKLVDTEEDESKNQRRMSMLYTTVTVMRILIFLGGRK